ncbi:MAG TPA: hypothetical protein DCW31_03930, partial [Lactobacillus sp.]|nr:hypothetical protein [Lactobacillus sp.]
MANEAKHEMVKKSAFSVLSLETQVHGDDNEMPVQKRAFWQSVNNDGSFDALDKSAVNSYIFGTNEFVNDSANYDIGRQVDADTKAEQNGQRIINFPAGDYLVVHDTIDTNMMDLFMKLETDTFYGLMQSIDGYKF